MTNPFSKIPETRNDTDKARVVAIYDRARVLWDLLDDLSRIPVGQREMSIAKTNLEQSVLWAVKGVTG